MIIIAIIIKPDKQTEVPHLLVHFPHTWNEQHQAGPQNTGI